MKKSLAVDANEANVIKRVGTGQYTYQLLSRWAKNKDYDFHLYLRRPPLPDMPAEADNWHYHVIGPNKAWTRLALPLKLALSRRHHVFWNPAHYLPPVTFSKSVVTIHDLAYEFFPDLFLKEDLYKLKNWTRQSVTKADRVIVVSEATKSDLIKVYGVPAKKVTVIPNGYDSALFNATNKVSREALITYKLEPKKYLLFMGTLQPRKNVIRLVQAFRLLKEQGYKGKLVLAGNIGWLAQETLAVIKNSPDAKDIVMTGYVSDQVRLTLYRHADVFVLPSLYEGFGVPVLEAMSSGCPVVASNNSSLPEVVGKAGLLFNPLDSADIARAIVEVKKERDTYIQKGLTHSQKYAWDICAERTLICLLETAKSS